MTGQEVDTGVISCIVAFVIFIKTAIEVTGSGYTPGSVPCLPAVAFEKTSERITVASVPFGPASAGREAADLIKYIDMARIKGAMATRKRRKKVLKAAKGYYGGKHRLFKTAKQAVMKSGQYAYIGRKQKKRDFRRIWITR